MVFETIKQKHAQAKKQGSKENSAIVRLGMARKHLRKSLSDSFSETAMYVRQASINQIQNLSRRGLIAFLDGTREEDVMKFIQKNPSALFDYTLWRKDVETLVAKSLINLTTADRKNLNKNQFKMNIFNKWLEAKKTTYQGRPLIEELKKFMIIDRKVRITPKEKRHLLAIDPQNGSGQLLNHAVSPTGSIFSPLSTKRNSSLRGDDRLLDRKPTSLTKQVAKLDDSQEVNKMVTHFYQYECDWQKMYKKIPLVNKYVTDTIQLLLAQPGLEATDLQSLNELSRLTRELETTYQEFLKDQRDWKSKKCSLNDVSQSFERVSLKLNLINKQSQFIEHMIETHLKQTPDYKRIAAAASASTPQGPTNVASTVLGEIENGDQWGATHEIKCLESLKNTTNWIKKQQQQEKPLFRSLSDCFDSVSSGP